jgi:DNA-binding NtrC family response regulator
METTPVKSQTPRILVADDQQDIRQSLRLLLKPVGICVCEAASPKDALETVRQEPVDLALVDLNYTRDTTSGAEGLELIEQLAQMRPELPVIALTAWGSVELAVEAMRRGARDFLEKPWNNQRLLNVIRAQLDLGRAEQRTALLEQENRSLRGQQVLVPASRSPAMARVLEMVRQVAPSDANVLVTGEHGTGKTLVARLIHAWSDRANQALVTVNIGGLPETVFESELFGHARGAFTDARQDRVGRFELADGGTLFLDEIANITPPLQVKLLRILESGEFEPVGSSHTRRVNVRLICATNADIHRDAAQGRFREDLLYRVNTVEVHLPPLRERREDMVELATQFLQRFAGRYRKVIEGFEPAAMEAMVGYGWPGNVRELEHVMERVVLLAKGKRIGATDLALGGSQGGRALEEMSLEEVECYLVQKAMERHGGNAIEAARALGLSRSAMYRRMGKRGG